MTNVSYPTGVVTSLRRQVDTATSIDMESSGRDDDITLITNLSSTESSYTLVQGNYGGRVIAVTTTPNGDWSRMCL